MSFLTLDDYRSVCDDYEFRQITQNDDIRQTAEAAALKSIKRVFNGVLNGVTSRNGLVPWNRSAQAAALEQIASYLRHRFDIDRAFSTVGTARNSMLVQCAVAPLIDEHQKLSAVDAGRASSLTDRAVFAPVEQEGAKIFRYSLHRVYIIKGQSGKPIYHDSWYMEANFMQDTILDEFQREGELRGYQLPMIGDKRKKPDKFPALPHSFAALKSFLVDPLKLGSM